MKRLHRLETLSLLSMSARNLSRHRVKTVITATAVAVSVAAYIIMDAWLLGMNLDSRRNIVSFEMGAARLQTASWFQKRDEIPMYESFPDAAVYMEALARSGYDSAPRFLFSGTLYSRSGSSPILFNAVDMDRERVLLRWTDWIEDGRLPSEGSFEVVLGSLAASKLRLGIPSRVPREEFNREIASSARTGEERAFILRLYREDGEKGKPGGLFSVGSTAEARSAWLYLDRNASSEERKRLWTILDASGRMDARISAVIDIREGSAIRHVNQIIPVKVVGVVNTPNPATNGNLAFIPRASLEDEAGMLLEGRVTEILIRKQGADDSKLPGKDESAASIEGKLMESLALEGRALPPVLAVHGWEEYCADYLAASRGDSVSTNLMTGFLFLLAFIGIANTMLMAILDRTRETGMLRALGMTDSQVLFLYVSEGGMIGALGSVIGVAIGCAVTVPMVKYGVDYSAMAEAMEGDYGYRIAALFKSAWDPIVIALSPVVATVLSALASLSPSLRSVKLPVTESLRFE